MPRRRLIARAEVRQPALKRRSITAVELLATAALALSTAVAVTAVSIGIARAEVLGVMTQGDATPFAIALAFGALMIYPQTDWIKAVDLSHFMR